MGTPGSGSIDVVIPTYNGERFILAALDSVNAQTVLPTRIIVVDDGSTDRTADVVRAYASIVPLTLLQQKNGGLSAARNAGIRASTGEYIALLDADDEWYPTKLEEQMRVFANTPFVDVGLVYTAYSIIDADGRPTDKFFQVPLDRRVRGKVFVRLLDANMITGSGSGVLVKRACFDAVGLFDEQLAACEDWDMWLRVAQKCAVDFVDKPLVKIRRHGENMQNDAGRMFRNILSFYDKWLKLLPAEQVVPESWAKVIFMTMVRRLPRVDFIILARTTLSPMAKARLRRLVWRRLKIYIVVRVLFIPFFVLLGLLQSARKRVV